MVVKAKAPLRISFAGGGTDIDPYLSDYGAYVLSAAITFYNRAVYPGLSGDSAIEQILSSIAGHGKVKILSDTEMEAGLGGSAASFVAGLKAIYPELNPEQLARLAFFLERKVQGIKGGWQDQICASFGGFLFITLEADAINLERLDSMNNFNRFLILVNAGKRLKSGNEIIEDQLRCYDAKVLHRQKQLARLLREAFVNKNYLDFGKLLDEAWQVKKKQSNLISSQTIDELYHKCLQSGAIGGILTGAGAGGYLLLMEHPEREGELRQNLLQLNIHYHNVEFDTQGAQII